MKYRRIRNGKIVEARQLTEESVNDIATWIRPHIIEMQWDKFCELRGPSFDRFIKFRCCGGDYIAFITDSDYVIQCEGKFYACNARDFDKEYEAVECEAAL